MIKSEEEITVDFSASCTIEEAIAKMLGWLQGPQFKKEIKSTKYGIFAGWYFQMAELVNSGIVFYI